MLIVNTRPLRTGDRNLCLDVALERRFASLAGSGVIALSKHDHEQAVRRGHSEEIVLAVARAPEQRLPVRPGREILQSRVAMPAGGTLHLVRVVVDAGPSAEIVVAVYRTTKIEQYWSKA